MDVRYELMKKEIERMKNDVKNPQYIDIEKVKQENEESKKIQQERKPDCLLNGWFTYIFVMIGGMIFNDYIYISLFATVYFFWWRNDKIEKENGRRNDF